MDETNEHAQSRSNTIIKQPCLRSIEPGAKPRYSFSVSRGELKLSRYEARNVIKI